MFKSINTIIFIISIVNCQSKKNISNFTPAHTTGEIIPPIQSEYIALTPNEVIKQYDKAYGSEIEMIDFLNKRTKHIHEVLTKKFSYIKAPLPQIYGIKSELINAFSISSSVCFPLKLKFKDLPNDNTSDQKNNSLLILNGKTPILTKENQNLGITCSLNKDVSDTELYKATKDLGIDLEQCFTRMGNIFVYNNKCNREFSYIYGQSDKILYYTAANAILFTTKILATSSEADILAILSHELAHYYRQHNFLGNSKNYNYFYNLDEHQNLNTIPPPTQDEELISLGRSARSITNEMISYYPIEPYTWLNPIAFRYLIPYFHLTYPYLKKECIDNTTSTNCTIPACDEIALITKNNSFMSSYPFQKPWPKEHQQMYFEIEKLSQICFKKIPTTSIENLQFYKNIPNSVMPFIGIEELTEQKNLYEIAKRIGRLAEYKIAEHNKNLLNMLQLANKKKIGLYTEEQNADELSIEINYLTGLNVHHFYESIFNLMKKLETKPKFTKTPGFFGVFPGSLNYEECKESFSKNFPKFVPVSNYSDPHHGRCFRIYNGYREYNAHKAYYDSLEKITPKFLFNEMKWKEMQNNLPSSGF